MRRLLVVVLVAFGFVAVTSAVGLALSFGWRPWTWLIVGVVLCAAIVVVLSILVGAWRDRSLDPPTDIQQATDRNLQRAEMEHRDRP